MIEGSSKTGTNSTEGTAFRVLWLVRHGERLDFVDSHWIKTAQRPYDPPLSPVGVLQAQRTGQRLAGEKIEHIFSSPFLRAVETASHIGHALKLPIKIESGLCEMFLREWFPSRPDFLPMAELIQQFPGIDGSYRSVVNPDYPESEEALNVRTAQTMELLTRRFEGNLLMIGHGASIWGLCRSLLSGQVSIQTPFCCLIKCVQSSGRWVMEKNGSGP